MNIEFTLDTTDFDKGVSKLLASMEPAARRALWMVGDKVLQLSVKEVPHDTGMLQASGGVAMPLSGELAAEVGYHTPYAARLHEHPEYKFQKGRKGKYLEDPLKNNLAVLSRFFVSVLKGEIRI